MTSTKTSNVSRFKKVACPNCAAGLKFYGSHTPHINECGFESYSLTCRACGEPLVGVVDPQDDTLTSDSRVVSRNLRRKCERTQAAATV